MSVVWVTPKGAGGYSPRSHAARAYSRVALCGRSFAHVPLRKEQDGDVRCPKCEDRT